MIETVLSTFNVLISFTSTNNLVREMLLQIKKVRQRKVGDQVVQLYCFF